MNSNLVCQVPGCTTNQDEIEAELQTYLGGYCQACEKPREGRLCGCAFPCSLTFKGQMLLRIHELLSIDPPVGMKAIQVCYKHPELLKKARETCIAIRDNSGETETERRSNKVKVVSRAKEKEEENSLGISLGSVVEDESNTLLGSLEKLGDISEVEEKTDGGAGDTSGNTDVASIVYTDLGDGKEQNLVGKIVYQTDEGGQSNIIIQEVGPGHILMGDKKIVKINLANMDAGVGNRGEGFILGQQEEALEQRLEEELEGNEARLEEELDFEASRRETDVKIKFKMADKMTELKNTIVRNHTSSMVTMSPTIQTSGLSTVLTGSLISPVISSLTQEIVGATSGSIQFVDCTIPQEEDDNMLKIQYTEYEQKILANEMSPLINCTDLCDTLLVCNDGKVVSSSLILAFLSPNLKQVMDNVPRIDPHRIVILPEEVTMSQVIFLHKVLLGTTKPLTLDEKYSISSLSSILGCEYLAHITSDDQYNTQYQSVPEQEAGNQTRKRSDDSSPTSQRRSVKQLKLDPEAGWQHPSTVKLEKKDLNSDYIDSNGLVRLNSVDEMSIHYCLLCEGKFKKYRQAITHYEGVHGLPVALSCDQCEETFRDMFSCTKHKHEKHGQFDINCQCYICNEVLYSRFRLGTHIKETHKELYGEFVCRTCGMKFSAQHYLTNHQRESHTDRGNTCTICSKTFSGKRYLTMHIKSHHESPVNKGGGELANCNTFPLFQCQICDRTFPSERDLSYHSSKVHGAPRPEGAFEDCTNCDKWFRTKGELALHILRMHAPDGQISQENLNNHHNISIQTS